MKHGFTLIEILVVVGIMGVLAAVGVASYNKIGDRAKVEQTAQLMATQIRAWQKDADSGVGNNLCDVGEVFGGTMVKWISASLVNAQTLCGASLKVPAKSFAVTNNNVVNIFANFTLFPLSKGVSPATNIVVQNAAGLIKYNVEILTSGSVNVLKL